MLPQHDTAYLAERFPGHSVLVEGGMVCVLLPGFILGDGFTAAAADLLLRLAPGYPDVAPDMWWFCPFVRRVDGREIPATQVQEAHFNKLWQRWSRHLNPGQWRSGVDGLESYFTLIRQELSTAGARSAA